MELLQHEKEHLETIYPHMGEFVVLLKKNNDFPLKEAGDIALYGNGGRLTIKGGTGSGEVNSRFFVNCEEGLKNKGFNVLTKSWLDQYDEIRKGFKEAFIKEIRQIAKKTHTNAIVTVCSRDSGVKRRLRIGGTKGTLEFSPVERFDGKEIEVHLVLKEPYGEYKAGGHILKFGPVLDRYEAQLQDFAAMIRGEKEDEYSRAHDYTVHEVILAASGIIKI